MLSIKGDTSQSKYFFRLGPQFADRKVINLRIKEPTIIKVTATWVQKNIKLTLILNGPGQIGYYARKDGYTPLTLEFEVTQNLINKGEGWKISLVNYNKGKIAIGKLNILLSKKTTSITHFPSVKQPAYKVVGFKEDFLEVPISKLKGKVATNFGKKEIPKRVRVKGYFYYDRVPIIISNPELLQIDSPLPEDSYIVLKGKIPSKSKIGQMLEISGNLQVIRGKVYLISIDYTYISKKPFVIFKPEKLKIGKRIIQFFPKKYAVIISGGIDEVNNHFRYWNNIKYIYNILKYDYGFSDKNIYVLYYNGIGEDKTVPVDYSCTKANLRRVFNELSAKMTFLDSLFIYTTNHGGEYKQQGTAGSKVGYLDGGIVFTGNEGNEIRESNFIIDGHDSNGGELSENHGYWFDFDGDGIRDDVVINRKGTLTMYVNGDPDEDYFIENTDIDGKDTNKDFIIDSNDGGIDLNDDGDKNDWVGIDEILYLWGDKIYDDEFAQMLQGLRYKRIIIVMGQCFSGGFINDLLGKDRIIITSATSWEYAWSTRDLQYSEFIYHLSQGLNKMTFSFLRKGRFRNFTIYLADTNNDKKISLVEAFNFALSKKTMPNTPLYEDNGVLPAQNGKVPRGGDGNLGKNTTLD